MASAEDVGGDAATPQCIDVFNLPKCRNGRKKYLFANWVYERVVTKKKEIFISNIQAVCWPFNSRREIHADAALVWV